MTNDERKKRIGSIRDTLKAYPKEIWLTGLTLRKEDVEIFLSEIDSLRAQCDRRDEFLRECDRLISRLKYEDGSTLAITDKAQAFLESLKEKK